MVKSLIPVLEKAIISKMQELFICASRYTGLYSQLSVVKDSERQLVWESFSDTYEALLCYLDLQGMQASSARLRKQLEKYIQQSSACFDIKQPYKNHRPYLPMVRVLEKALSEFKFYTDRKENLYLFYIRDILRQSNSILAVTNPGKAFNTEVLLDKVKWVLSFFFVDIDCGMKAVRRKKTATFEPDLIVPEVNVAIKFRIYERNFNGAKYFQELRASLTQQHAALYRHTFMVVILNAKSYGVEKELKEQWIATGFPDEWELLVVQG